MTPRRARSFGLAYAHLMALLRLRAVVNGDVLPREDEPVCIFALLVIR